MSEYLEGLNKIKCEYVKLHNEFLMDGNFKCASLVGVDIIGVDKEIAAIKNDVKKETSN